MHRTIYGRLGGRLGTSIGPFRVLLLTTTGRRSGSRRTVALNYLGHESGPAIIGSYAGEHRDPAWVLNLRTDPACSVQTGAERWSARAREVFGVERDEIARHFESLDAAYRVYRERTERSLPVFVLERIAT